MIRVAHVVASFDVGGLQKGVVNIINRSRGCQHLVVSFGPGLAMADRLDHGDVESLGLEPGQRRSLAAALRDVLQRFGADVVHTRNWPTLVDGWRARRRARTASHVHGYHGRDASGARGFGWKRRLIGRALTRSLDAVVTLTPHMAEEYTRDFGTPKRGLHVIENGVELPEVAVSRRTAGDPLQVLAVGRLDPVKDYGSLIRAFARMPGRGVDDRLVIAGDGPEREALAATCDREGVADAVKMPGMLQNTAAVYRDADVFVQSSVYEGMSNTLAEAMAAGLPCVASRVGGNPDVVGGAGVFYESGDDAVLAERLAALRRDPARASALGDAARERAREVFGMDRMVQAYDELYHELAGRS